MIKQKAIYNKDFNLIEYKEYHSGTLVKHERFDDNGNIIEQLYSDGRWMKYQFDTLNRCNYKESNCGDWTKYFFDARSNVIRKELSNGYWCDIFYDSLGRKIRKETAVEVVLYQNV